MGQHHPNPSENLKGSGVFFLKVLSSDNLLSWRLHTFFSGWWRLYFFSNLSSHVYDKKRKRDEFADNCSVYWGLPRFMIRFRCRPVVSLVGLQVLWWWFLACHARLLSASVFNSTIFLGRLVMLLFSAEQMFLEQTGSGSTGHVMKEPSLKWILGFTCHDYFVCLKTMMH